jgi:hypothetical protein
MSCQECQFVPELKEQRGCETPTQQVVWEDDEDVFYSCPILWITPEIISWYDEVAYSKEFGGTPYPDQSNRFVEAWLFYNSEMNRFTKLKMEKGKEDKTTDGLSTLRSGFKARGK